LNFREKTIGKKHRDGEISGVGDMSRGENYNARCSDNFFFLKNYFVL
jgi:hypothetical protein